MDIAEIDRTYDCKTPDCTGTARTNRGPTAYLCDACKQRRASLSTAPKPLGPKTGSLEQRVKDLAAEAKNADKLAAHAKTLTERALAAKANADDAAERVKDIARSLYT